MKKHPLSPILWLLTLVLLVSLACGGPAATEEPAAVEPAQPAQEEPVANEPQPAQEEEPAPAQPVASGAVNSLEDARGAIIQIEAQGSFTDPEWGEYVSGGRGSGFIIDPSGIAVTNNHVVTGAALLKVWIGGDTSKTYNAKVLGVSECSDLAVIDIDGDGFPYLEWYNDPVKVGLEVYTAGFPLGDTEYALTKGIVSKENEDGETYWASVDSVIMHDATINPGNSGGPLIDENGKVVAVNYSGWAEVNQYFAIGQDVAIPVIEQLRQGKDLNAIGLNGRAVISNDGSFSGVWVTSVQSGSPADKAGVQGGDILTSLEGIPIATDGTMSEYCDVLRTHTRTDTMSIEVLRYFDLEMYEGQLNGRELAFVGSLNAGNDSGGNTGSDTGGNAGGTDAPAFYVEEFDVGGTTVNNWSWFTTSGNESLFDIYTQDGKLVFDINGAHLYTYFAYDPWFYENVRVDARAENRGKNNNNVSLICRGTEDGWYEFSIANNGLWWIYAYDGANYTVLAEGGSNAINMGKGVNDYAIMCFGDQLSLYINGQHTHTLQEKNFSFREGQVAIGVSSLDTLPIKVEFDWVAINENMQ